MGAETKIEWADHTWNPWYGCTPVSEGCENCYALRRMQQLKRVSGPGDIHRASAVVQRFPLSKKVKAGDKVFVCSWGDFFHKNGEHEWLREAWEVMRKRPDVTFLVLTKRPERITTLTLPANAVDFAHVWLGVTAENRRQWNHRVGELMRVKWPGKRFVSCEPLLGGIDADFCDASQALGPCGECGETDPNPACEACDGLASIDWVICGGETGRDARPMNPQWVRRLRDQCVDANVPFFFKQWGEWAPSPGARWHHHKLARMYDGWVLPAHGGRILRDLTETHYFDAAKADGKVFRVGKKKAGRMLDGRTWEEVAE